MSDSKAGRAMATRLGAGKVRHLSVRFLWIQEYVRKQLLQVLPVLGTENPADVCTKHVSQETLLRHLWKLGLATTYDTIASCLGLSKTLSLGPAAGW